MNTLSLNSLSIKNANISTYHSSSPSIPSLHFQPLSLTVTAFSKPSINLRLLHPSLRRTTLSSSAASREESASPDFGAEKNNDDHDAKIQEKKEALRKALESFKEKTTRSREERKVILEEKLEDLKIRAERARKDLNKLANEAAEHSPEGVKEILETLISSTDLKDISELKDYHVGIGYGSFVFASGFTAFMLAGSISAVRFGVILGGALVALGMRSRRAQNNGEAYDLPLKGQTAIATVIFLRKLTLLFQRSSLFQFVSAVISGVFLLLYCYRIGVLKGDGRGTNSGLPAEDSDAASASD